MAIGRAKRPPRISDAELEARLRAHLHSSREPDPPAPPRRGVPQWVKQAADKAERQQRERNGRGAGSL